MKLLSRSAIAIALCVGAPLVFASPVLAKEKKEKAKKGEDKAAKAPAFSKAFQPAIVIVDKAIKEKRFDDALTALVDAKTKAASPYEHHWVERYRMIAYANKNDKAKQYEAVLAMLGTGGVPEADQGLFNYVAGSLSYDAAKYPEAVKYFTEADRLGYKAQSYLISLADAHYKLGNYAGGAAAVDKAIAQEKAAGKVPPESWYRVSIRESSKAKNVAETARWSRAYIRAYPTAKVWNQGLVLYRDFSRLPVQQQIDVFRLMHQTGALAGGQDYLDYAALAMERGMPGPGESSSVLAEGQAKGLIDAAALGKFIGRPTPAAVAADKAGLPAEEGRANSSADGKKAYDTGHAFLGYGENAKALALFDLALKKGGAAIDPNAVNLRKGIALTRLGRKAEAKAAFDLVSGIQKEVASFWNLYLELNP